MRSEWDPLYFVKLCIPAGALNQLLQGLDNFLINDATTFLNILPGLGGTPRSVSKEPRV
jgi:hypothetical protein